MNRKKAILSMVFVSLFLSFLPLLAVQVDGAGFGGYTYRVRCKPQFMDNEAVTMDVQACRTTIQGKPMSEPVTVQIKQALLINGTPQKPYKTVYNTTITGSAKYNELNIGRQDIGTWDVVAVFGYTDGHEITTTFTYMVTHRPTQYWIMWQNNGRDLVIRAQANITVEVYEFQGSSTTLLDSSANVTHYNLTIHPSKATISVYVEIEDQYGWKNAMSDQQHKHDYGTDPHAEQYAIITTAIVAGVSLLAIAILYIATHTRRRQL